MRRASLIIVGIILSLSSCSPPPTVSFPTQNTIAIATTPQALSATPQPSPLPLPTCLHPQSLAEKKGWQDLGWGDEKFGGLNVLLTQEDQLPPLWEAIQATPDTQIIPDKRITSDATDRGMPIGVWTIYTPLNCRSQFGFAQ